MNHSLSPRTPDVAQPSVPWDGAALVDTIRAEGLRLGFAAVAIADVDVVASEAAGARLADWLARGFHGDMAYLARHGAKRVHPPQLVPGTVRVIAVRMNYLPDAGKFVEEGWQRLRDARRANVSAYAHGRDYHKVVRARLQRLADFIATQIGPFGYRVFTDSAPVMEVELAQRAGLGWRGKHTLLLSREGGSAFFLGEIFVDLPLPLSVEAPSGEYCGTCRACIDVCPTGAIVAPYQLDARRCISYLTIELKGSIPEDLRPLIGNRVYGCDDCQLVCPWNKYAQSAVVDDFAARGMQNLDLINALSWDEATFLKFTEGSAVRRIGHERWLRNVAVAAGNALADPRCSATSADVDGPAYADALRTALAQHLGHPSPLVREHVVWALAQGVKIQQV